jgi:hypothetical protein
MICDLTSGTFKLVSVPAAKTCSADEWCVLNGLGEYNCAKKPGKSNDKLLYKLDSTEFSQNILFFCKYINLLEKNVLYLRKFIPS